MQPDYTLRRLTSPPYHVTHEKEIDMTKQKFRVAVIKFIEVEFDLDKLDNEFWSDFNASIDDRGGPDIDYLAEHAAWNYVQGDHDFIEGIGDLTEMNIRIAEVDSEVTIDADSSEP